MRANPYLLLILFVLTSIICHAQPSNDDCSAPATLTPQLTCSTTSGTLYMASVGLPSSTCGTANDVWYTMTVPSNANSITIDVAATGNNLSNSNTFFAVYSGSGCTLTLLTGTTCTAAGTSLVLNTVTPSATYFVRVFTTTNTSPNGGSNAKFAFTICATYIAPPANDDCAGATTLTMGSATAGTVWLATASSGIPTGCATGNPDDDVWYQFTATSTKTSIALSSIGSDLSASGTTMQLFSGSCGALTSMACTGTSTLYVTNLTVGQTYYVRVYSYVSGALGTASSGSSFTITTSVPSTPTSNSGEGGRMKEVFQQTVISPANGLSDPWEVVYGPDGFLWITEAKGYKLYRMDPTNGTKITVLDISQNSTFLPTADRGFNVQFSSSQNPWPQGGFAGMALHPQFLDPVSPKNYIYISYVHTYISGTSASTSGVFFTNRLVRFTYNTTTGKLESPVSLCDTLPGSSDHNSQRMIIAPYNGTYYLFYAQGDMGAGQFTNLTRINKAQDTLSYEGKILRFNLEPDGDAGAYDKWIPSDNPFNSTRQSVVWCMGIRNNQGFGYAKINGVDRIYGSSHGPYSDDEINIIQPSKNYGHPWVIGFAADTNYNHCAAGPSNGSLPIINSETANATALGVNYQDPIITFYSAPQSSIYNIWTTNPNNNTWPSEAPSGMEVYTNSIIPGWKNSILQSMLKGGKVMRLKLNANGDGISPTNGADTVSYFYSVNRFRDVAIAPDGKTIYTVIDKSSTTSGPTTTNPMVSACAGCVIKYTFLGYNTSGGKSTIPSSIDVSQGTANSCTTANTITIDNTNNTLWVPITGTDGNIIAEINANGYNLGTVTTSLYNNSGTVREDGSKKLYADRNITITPQNQPGGNVSIRLYLTAAELNALKSATNSLGNPSMVNTISDLKILKNSDACGPTLSNSTSVITPLYAEAFGNNYVLQGSINSFSTFYFGNPSMAVLPLQLIRFGGMMQGYNAVLKWETANERNSAFFVLERSLTGTDFTAVGNIRAAGSSYQNINYEYTDNNAGLLPADILYYRLKMVDQDGRYTYSQVVTLSLIKNNNVIIFPNPAKQDLNIRLNRMVNNAVILEITDLHGKVLMRETRNGSEPLLNVDIHRLPSQVYLLRVFNNGELIGTQRFEKL